MNGSRVLRCVGMLAALAAFAGCSPEARFRFNAVYALKQSNEMGIDEFTAAREREVGDILVAMFGTPDQPHVPRVPDVEIERVLDVRKLSFAAGPVGRDENQRMRGLYREHCAHCHGITGDGAGPTAAFLNPYPRDYRMGIFKFKSTPIGYKPTHEDLLRILREGIEGTAMPSFKVLPENEIEALVHYVRYLSIRGEVERGLLNYLATEASEDEPLINLEAGEQEKSEQVALLNSFVADVVDRWIMAESLATPVEPPDSQRDLNDSVARGREIFYGAVANCFTCHGDSQLGDGQLTDYDKWTEELTPKEPEILEEYLALGALEPRNSQPRNLRLGVYRGGRRPIDIYWRIRNGIDGTTMPAATMKPEDASPGTKGLTQDDIWCLIDYVRSLPYEELSDPFQHEPNYQRARL